MIEKMKRVIGIYMEGDEGIANGRKERHYDQGGYGAICGGQTVFIRTWYDDGGVCNVGAYN